MRGACKRPIEAVQSRAWPQRQPTCCYYRRQQSAAFIGFLLSVRTDTQTHRRTDAHKANWLEVCGLWFGHCCSDSIGRVRPNEAECSRSKPNANGACFCCGRRLRNLEPATRAQDANNKTTQEKKSDRTRANKTHYITTQHNNTTAQQDKTRQDYTETTMVTGEWDSKLSKLSKLPKIEDQSSSVFALSRRVRVACGPHKASDARLLRCQRASLMAANQSCFITFESLGFPINSNKSNKFLDCGHKETAANLCVQRRRSHTHNTQARARTSKLARSFPVLPIV